VLCYGLNIWLNVFLYALLVINLAVNIKKDRFFYTFFALVFFETQVHSTMIFAPIMFTSLIKVYYVLYIVRVIIDLIGRTKYKFDWISTILALLLIGTSFMYAKSFSSGASYMAKTSAVILYMLYYLRANGDRDDMLGEFLSVVALFTLFAGVYALSRGVYWDNRLCSTVHDPNYSAMFYAMGLFASFGATKFKKWIRIIISIVLIGLLLMTMSITGIMVTSLILLIYFLFTKGWKKVLIVLGVIIVVVGAILFVPTKEGSTLDNLQNRVSKFYVIDETDYTLIGHDDYTDTELYLNYITNNRYYLNESYIAEYSALPAREKLFGGNNVMTGELRDRLQEKYDFVSHNTYLDMLFMIGLIPALMLAALLIWKVVRIAKEYRKTRSKQVFSFLFVKIVMMVFALTISFFPYRYFVVFMLI